ncbi:MAG: hypothetical protein Q9227_000292 [Pyrenula ochraceoflavens]
MSLWIQLHNDHTFTNLDFISGKVVFHLRSEATISTIAVKLEGESRTRLAGPRGPADDDNARKRMEYEEHKPMPSHQSAQSSSQSSLTPPTPSQPSSFSGPPPPIGAHDEYEIPDEAPPSYEDAMAEDIAPVDGPRRDYTPSESISSQMSSEKGSGIGRRVSERLFASNNIRRYSDTSLNDENPPDLPPRPAGQRAAVPPKATIASIMRLRVNIQRHGLPATNILWTSEPAFPHSSASHKSATISQFVEDVNSIVPLESGEWGLEDYVVEVGGYECLHFQPISIFQENDQVVIRPLLTSDLRQRRITGRHQVTSDGRHLIDGVAYGRQYLKKAQNRPEIPLIPSRKRKRSEVEQYVSTDESNSDPGVALPAYLGQHLITGPGEPDGLADESDEDDNYTDQGTEDDDDGSTDLEQEVQDLQDDRWDDEDVVQSSEETVRPSKRRRTRALSALSRGLLNTQPLLEYPRQSSLASSDRNGALTGTKISKSVSFETQPALASSPGPEATGENASISEESSEQELSSEEESSDSSSGNGSCKEDSAENTSRSRKSKPDSATSISDSSSSTTESDSGDSDSDSDSDTSEDSESASEDQERSSDDSSEGESSSSSDTGSDINRGSTSPGRRRHDLSPNTEESSGQNGSDSESSTHSSSRNLSRRQRPFSSRRRVQATFPSDSSASDSDTSDESDTPKSAHSKRHSRTARSDRQPASASESSSSDSETSGDDSGSRQRPGSASTRLSSEDSYSSISSTPAITSSKQENQQESRSLRLPVQSRQSAPGKGLSRTKQNNKRQHRKRVLSRLKAEGLLPSEAGFRELEDFQSSHASHSEPDGRVVTGENVGLQAKKEGLLERLKSTEEPLSQSTEQRLESMDGSPQAVRYVNRTISTSSDPTPKGVKLAQNAPLTPANTTVEHVALSEPAPRRARLDVESSRRMLFGSLGVRAPKSKSEERELRAKFASESKRKPVALSDQIVKPSQSSNELKDDGADRGSQSKIGPTHWSDKLIISAVECQVEDVPMTAPPFPFVQGWDKQALESIRSRKDQSDNSNKKQKTARYNNDTVNTTHSSSYNEDQGDTWAKAPEKSLLNHSSPTGFNGAIRDQLMREANDISALSPEDPPLEEDLPVLPEDLSQLQDLKASDITPGTIIAYQTLRIGSDFQPSLSPHVTAKIQNVLGDGTLEIRLAKRDQKENTEPNLTGLEEYEITEEPSSLVQVPFDSMLSPKLVQMAHKTSDGEEGQAVVAGEDQSLQEEETSRTMSHGDSQVHGSEPSVAVPEADPPLPAPAPPVIDTPRREEISAMIKEAGFESGIDSELRKSSNTRPIDTTEKTPLLERSGNILGSSPAHRNNQDSPGTPISSKGPNFHDPENNFESISEPVFAGFDSSPRPSEVVAFRPGMEELPITDPLENIESQSKIQVSDSLPSGVHYPSLPLESDFSIPNAGPVASARSADDPTTSFSRDSQQNARPHSSPAAEDTNVYSLKSTVPESEPSPVLPHVTNPFHVSYSQSDGNAGSEEDESQDLLSIENLVSSTHSPMGSPASLKVTHKKRTETRYESPAAALSSNSTRMTRARARSLSRSPQTRRQQSTDTTNPQTSDPASIASNGYNIVLPASQIPEESQIVDLTQESSSPVRAFSDSDGDGEYSSSQIIKDEASSQLQRKTSLRRKSRGTSIVAGLMGDCEAFDSSALSSSAPRLWRQHMLSFLFVVLLLSSIVSLAQDWPQDDSQQSVLQARIQAEAAAANFKRHGQQKATDLESSKSSSDTISAPVGKALEILERLPRTSTSRGVGRKPSGFTGYALYYSKHLFRLLFLNEAPSREPTSAPASANISPTLQKAVHILENAAYSEDPDAIYLLAEMNFYGNFTHPRNYKMAFARYSQLAGLTGNSTAQYMLGLMYATGIGGSIERDQAKALLYHTAAAEQGNVRSEMTVAFRHHSGIGTPRNCDEAAYFYKRVADKAMAFWQSGPPGGVRMPKESFRWADAEGGVYGEGASAVTSHGKTHSDVENLVEYLDLWSRDGDMTAAFNLGQLYYDGTKDMKRNVRKAHKMFMKVAKAYWDKAGKVVANPQKGIENAAGKSAGFIGRMFLRGELTEQSFEKAATWFKRGIAVGDKLSQYLMGILYRDGLGVPQDPLRAAAYFKAAADQDLGPAQSALGVFFLDQGDVETAIKYFEVAARHGWMEAFYYLAEIANKGVARERSCGYATTYYKMVAEKAEAMHSSFTEANDAYASSDFETALIASMMGAEQGYEPAQSNIAYLLDSQKSMLPLSNLLPKEDPNVPFHRADGSLALIYWTRSAKQSNLDSLIKMGDYYLAGTGTARDVDKASTCYHTAADGSAGYRSSQALWNLGWMHENGISVEQDFHLAKRFYDLALELKPEAYLPVKLSLIKLRARSYWNDLTRGPVQSIHDEEDDSDVDSDTETTPGKKKKQARSLSEWIAHFLSSAYEDDNNLNPSADNPEYDEYGNHNDPMPGGDLDPTMNPWDAGYENLDDDGLLESLIIIGLAATLALLVWWRGVQRERHGTRDQHNQRHGNGEGRAMGQGQGAVQPLNPNPNQSQNQNPNQNQNQQEGNNNNANGNGERGFFPAPGDPQFRDWVAGGVGH